MTPDEVGPDVSLTGRRVKLRPLEPADYPYLRRLELSEQLAFRWRHRGRHEAPENFAALLWADSLVNFIAESTEDHRPIAILSAYAVGADSSTCYFGAARFEPESIVASPTVGAMGLALDYLFAGWPFRKIYLESPEYNVTQFDGAVGWLIREEGRLIEHTFLNGRYWDHITFALWRSDWLKYRRHLTRFA